jgi:hypothetical protein
LCGFSAHQADLLVIRQIYSYWSLRGFEKFLIK